VYAPSPAASSRHAKRRSRQARERRANPAKMGAASAAPSLLSWYGYMGTMGSGTRWAVVALFTTLGCGGTSFGPMSGDDGGADGAVDAAAHDAAGGDGGGGGTETGAGTDGAGPDASVSEAGVDGSTEASSSQDGASNDGASGDGPVADGDAGAAPDGDDSDGASGNDAGGGPEACVPVLYYNDGDDDGYGGTTTVTQCDPPTTGHWVTQGGDCDDSNQVVSPGQTAYFPTGYVPTGQSTISFDYDCDGVESESGNAVKASCQTVALACTGSGYIEASTVRSGAGVDRFCGSDQAVTCAFVSLACKAGSPYTTGAIACR